MPTLHVTDLELHRQLSSGDESVLGVILKLHGPAVLALLRQRFGGLLVEQDFEDVLAMSLFRVWQHRKNYDPNKASLRVWLFRIAANLCRDVLKFGWQKARQLEVPDAGQLSNAVSHDVTGSSAFENNVRFDVDHAAEDSSDAARASESSDRNSDRQIVKELRQILNGLPEAQRRILLADAASPEGKVSSQDLSNELGIPASTVRVYRRRAIQHLRKEMDHRGIRRQ
jgi:RNA polymerase sigma factor (sigma-70 family)